MARKDKKQNRKALEAPQTSEVAWLSTDFQEHPVRGLTPTIQWSQNTMAVIKLTRLSMSLIFQNIVLLSSTGM